mmetsp:Transcript_20328/g.29477  ORF Transcript_20328/g.29477 Transcript_20328/m.29477 type:complete len:83 (-) Transcript_20328:127-375(-)
MYETYKKKKFSLSHNHLGCICIHIKSCLIYNGISYRLLQRITFHPQVISVTSLIWVAIFGGCGDQGNTSNMDCFGGALMIFS